MHPGGKNQPGMLFIMTTYRTSLHTRQSGSSSSINPRKRNAEHLEGLKPTVNGKLTKGILIPPWVGIKNTHTECMIVHPFFAKPVETESSTPFIWSDPLGPTKSCLHGINLKPISRSKVAAFDLDGTLIKSEFGNKSAASNPHWEWWRTSVPIKLKDLHESG